MVLVNLAVDDSLCVLVLCASDVLVGNSWVDSLENIREEDSLCVVID